METAGGVPSACSSSENGVAPSASPNTKIPSRLGTWLAASRARSRKAGTVSRYRARQSFNCLASSALVYSGLIVVFTPPRLETA